jgi:hypothetical protein
MGDKALADFLHALKRDDFKGPVIFELSIDEAQASMEKIRQVAPSVI